MEIHWLGISSFLIKNSTGKRILIDPFLHNCTKETSSLLPNIITLSHNHFDIFLLDKFRDSCTIINSPSIYTNDFCIIEGFESFHDDCHGMKRGKNIIYKLKIDNITLCHLGDLGHLLSNEIITQLGKIDVLFIPIGGHLSLTGECAAKLTKLINPKIVIPMHYRTPYGPNYLDGPQQFIKQMNTKSLTKENPFNLDTMEFSVCTQILILNYTPV